MKKTWIISTIVYVAIFVAMKIMFEVNLESGIASGYTKEVLVSSPQVLVPFTVMCLQIPVAIIAVVVASISWIVKKNKRSSII